MNISEMNYDLKRDWSTVAQCGKYTLDFGKYIGMSLSDIYHKDKEYLFWLSETIKKKDVKEKVMVYLGYPKEIIDSL